MFVLHYFRTPAFTEQATRRILKEAQERLPGAAFDALQTEFCFSVGVSRMPSYEQMQILRWLLAETFEPENFDHMSLIRDSAAMVMEVGPRLNVETAYSSSAMAACHKFGLDMVERIERSRRFGINSIISNDEVRVFLAPLFDRMTEEPYHEPLTSFTTSVTPQATQIIPLLEEGIDALRAANTLLGLAMDEQDLDMWFRLFVHDLKRNPTNVELFQIGQANSEHCRHGFFKGEQIINGFTMPDTLMDIVSAPWRAKPGNSVIAFADNSSAIRGHRTSLLLPQHVDQPGPYVIVPNILVHPTLTAETHNHPTGVEPFEGAATGGGGRIRDNQMVGRGGLPVIAGAGYCVANLRIPGYPLPWEKDCWDHPANLAAPLDILIQASNGASSYGNCFGEPITYGFVRTFEQDVFGQHRAWFKPIMYSVGAGMVRSEHVVKQPPEMSFCVVLLGGPGYRIGVGGGSASSMIAGANTAELDFASVQRSNPEMENRVDRVIRACISLGTQNPIRSAHDLGAGGVCNAIPEIVNPLGAYVSLGKVPTGDASLSPLEIWGNESQERNVVLVDPDDLEMLERICSREHCPMAVIGSVTGDGNLIVGDGEKTQVACLPLDRVLGKLPQKTFQHERIRRDGVPLNLEGVTVRDALDRVLRLPSVASKRWLTTKVDRSVGGLVAQQQCVGPNHTPIADFTIRADSHFGLTGSAHSLGEQPIVGLLNPKAMARLAISEALLNLCGAKITALEDVRCSANWMWAAKLPGEGSRLYDAACAARDAMIELWIAIDGGKDSLSMAANVVDPEGQTQIVKAPGELVIATYAAMEDITIKATPDLKRPGNLLVLIEPNDEAHRLGGSALAQVYGQLGDETPDVDWPIALRKTFEGVQEAVARGLVQSVHDRSDGGLITTLLEMAFAGNVGITVEMDGPQGLMGSLSTLFAEEPGVVLEVDSDDLPSLQDILGSLTMRVIGVVGTNNGGIIIRHNNLLVLKQSMATLRSTWEETSSQLDALQANPDCVRAERFTHLVTTAPPYHLTFTPHVPHSEPIVSPVRVALVREEGTNGDREMAAALHLAGFEVGDVNMDDLLLGKVRLDHFRGLVFPGGFSFGDVLDAGKGWAGVIRFNSKLAEQFDAFRRRPDTFSLGVCNGCQLMALLGWVPGYDLPEHHQPRFIGNVSERFESRFPTVHIRVSPSIMFRGMEGSTLGVWVSHGEGRLHVEHGVLERIIANGQAPLRYVDHHNSTTTAYPDNPNGSPAGIAALCSEDGRHLAMMPHPERTVLKWQWPWMPKKFEGLAESPWLQMFRNAHKWCVEAPPQ